MARRRGQFSCYNCDEKAQHAHHLIPKAVTRKHDLPESRTIPVCHKCHGFIHDLDFTSHSKLVIEGLKRARSERPCWNKARRLDISKKTLAKARKLRKGGTSWRELAKMFGISKSTLIRRLNEN